MKLPMRPAAALLIICLILFGTFFVTVYRNEHIREVQHHNACSTYETLTDFSFSQWDDPTAPVGIRQEYAWVCPKEEFDGASLAFYLVHQSVQVYYNNQLVYSLEPDHANSLTHSPGSHWVMLPLHDSSNDCQIRLVITPYYSDIVQRNIEILMGSLYRIFLDIIRENLIYVMLSILSFTVGGAMLLICFINLLQHKKYHRTMGYMALTMLLIGLWRITDTKLSAFLFPNNVLALDYITIGTLFLISIPFGLSTRKSVQKYMYPISLSCAVLCLLTIVGHLLNWWDIRHLLILSHAMIILNALVLIGAEIMLLLRNPVRSELNNLLLSLLPISGALADIISFYMLGSSAGIFFVIIGFLLYAALSFAVSWYETSRKMFTDAHTGLYNRARWENLMNDPHTEQCGIILFDLNGLKQVNDRLGHEAGDAVILSFADILRSIVTPQQILCRWGGDEFAIYVPHADASLLQHILEQIRTAVDKHNTSALVPKVQYAAGFAASSDHPDLSRRELFRLADARMYKDKNK